MIDFTVQNLTCGHCVSTIPKALQAVDPNARVDVDLASKRVRVEAAQPREALASALADAGYPPA